MKCPRCQAENPAGMKFCGQCAEPLASVCPSCGIANPPENKFCGQCAALLRRGAQSRFAGPDSYTPKHLVEKILTSKAALEGERKQVTVLFADLKGSTELLADRDPEDARKILDPVLEHMMEAVHRYEGTVNQVMGDGIMALFGAPLAHEDHAVRGCYAALRMQESIKRYSEGVRRVEGIPIRIRVGLNSGEVVVRAIGGDLHMDYTAVGQTTHLAARMEQIADAGATLLTPATLGLAEGFVDVKSLGPTSVKGFAEPIEVYELTGASAARSRLQAAAARGLTKFVGRSAEMAQLHEALELTRSGTGQLVGVVGEPGVGKSRVYWEFTHSHRTTGCLICEAASVSYGKATPYAPVIELLKSYFVIEPRDDARKIREKVTGKMLSLDRALEPSLLALLSLLDVPLDDDAWSRLDPPQRRQRTLEAVKRLLLRETQVQPLLVVFEDLHWIDGETQALLDTLIESIPTARLLLLVTYRPEYQHPWGSKTFYRQLRVDALPAASADELLDSLLGSDTALTTLKRVLIERTEGNPFFLEESVRTLIETGVLAGARGDYRLARASASLQIPSTVQAVLAARIDRLDPEAKRLLQAAAVIGKDFAVPLLAAIAEMPDERLHSSLARLQAAEFVYEARLFPEVEYTFKHALTHEVAYGGLLHERRRELHARIVDASDAMYRDRLGDQVERLAHHALKAERWSSAVQYSRQAGAKVLARSANREAAAYFEQALRAAEHLEETRENLERAIDLRLDLRDALIRIGEVQSTRVHLQMAETLAATLGDQHRLARVASLLSDWHWLVGEHEQAVAAGQRALDLAAHLSNSALLREIRFYLGQAYHGLGDYGQGLAFLERPAAPGCGDDDQTEFDVFARTWAGWCHAERGEFDQALSHSTEGIRIAESRNHPWLLFHAHLGEGIVHVTRGVFGEAIRSLERARAYCEDSDLPFGIPFISSFLSSAYAQSGRLSEAFRVLSDGLERAEAMGFMAGHSHRLASLAELHLLERRPDQASELARRALALAETRKEHGIRGHVLRLLGDIAFRFDSPASDTVTDHYRKGLAVGSELGMRPLAAHCHTGLAKLHRRTGKRIESDEHFATATSMYREMGMTYWLDRAETEMKELA